MKYGCIGKKLSHSFSREIHEMIGGYEYSLIELSENELSEFFKKRDFSAINVTIPYKEAVIPFLDEIHPSALSVGAVNTVVNRGGALIGYNTDIYGMEALIKRNGIDIEGKAALILGSGGTSKTARAVLEKMGASKIITVSRNPDKGEISYTDVYKKHLNTEIIVNTTPVGMFPNIFSEPIDISAFENLYAVIDAVYNPERTLLLQRGSERGAKTAGGLYMLISQAIFASELFLGVKYPRGLSDEIYEKTIKSKRNIALIGMPSSGKSTVGKILASELCRPLYDTDFLIEERCGASIKSIFKERGEGYFRDAEAEEIKRVAPLHSSVISVGGGAVLRKDNLEALRANSNVVYIKRPLSALMPSNDRPLSASEDALSSLYHERLPIYEGAADIIIDAGCDSPEDIAKRITEVLNLT